MFVQGGGLFRRMFSGSTWSLSSSDTLQQTTIISPTHERRPLKSTAVKGPNVKIPSKALTKDYIEKEARVYTSKSNILLLCIFKFICLIFFLLPCFYFSFYYIIII